jgi:hypothetical protein
MDDQRSAQDVLHDEWATEWLEYREWKMDVERERLERHGEWTVTGLCPVCGVDKGIRHTPECRWRT